jgi:hypothetical protein
MLVVELVAAWVEHKVMVTEITVGTVDAEAVIAHTTFGVTVVGGVVIVVYGVIINAVVFAVLVTVENLHLLQLCCWCGVAVIHPRSVGSFMCSVALWFCFGGFGFYFSGFWWIVQQGSK